MLTGCLEGEIILCLLAVSSSELGAVCQEEPAGAWEGTDWLSLSPRYQLLRRDCIPHGLGTYCTVLRVRHGDTQPVSTDAVAPAGAGCREGSITELRDAQRGY